MPDEPRVPYRPSVRIEPQRPIRAGGFDRLGTSGLTARELDRLDRALARLVAAGLSERAAKLALDAAIRDWLAPDDADDADLERLLAWR